MYVSFCPFICSGSFRGCLLAVPHAVAFLCNFLITPLYHTGVLRTSCAISLGHITVVSYHRLVSCWSSSHIWSFRSKDFWLYPPPVAVLIQMNVLTRREVQRIHRMERPRFIELAIRMNISALSRKFGIRRFILITFDLAQYIMIVHFDEGVDGVCTQDNRDTRHGISTQEE